MKRNCSATLSALQSHDSDAPVSAVINVRINLFPEDKTEIVRKVERSIAYMVEHIDKPLQVANLAAQVNVSPSHFFALFKRQTGYPPMGYFTKLRIRHACRLLDSTTASVKEVAAALGYDDPFHFSRVFKAVTDMPPSRYRTAREEHSKSTPASRLWDQLFESTLIPA